MVAPLNTIPDPYGLRCAGCNEFIDGWRPGFSRFCDRCAAGEPPPGGRRKPPLTTTADRDEDPELADADAMELIDA
jgi:hypothetical protein